MLRDRLRFRASQCALPNRATARDFRAGTSAQGARYTRRRKSCRQGWSVSASLSLDDFLRDTIAQSCRRDPAEIHAQTRLLDLGIDSLLFVSIVAQVEAVHRITFDLDSVFALMEEPTLGSLALSIRELIGAHGMKVAP